MTTITTRKLDQVTYNKVEIFLQQAGERIGDNLYAYFLMDMPDQMMGLNAFVQLQDNKIGIKAIWENVFDSKKGMFVDRNLCGERGRRAKVLSEKYLNRFFDYLSRVDIDNIQERQFMLTPDVAKSVEAEIDRSVDPKRITKENVRAYGCVELTTSAEQAIIYVCQKLDEDDYYVAYKDEEQVFEVVLFKHGLGFKVPLEDIVRKKWERGETFVEVAIEYVGHLILAAKEYHTAHKSSHMI